MSLKTKISSLITMVFAAVAFTTFAVAQDAKPSTQDGVQKQEKGQRGWGKRGEGRRGFKGMHGRGGRMMFGLRGIDLTDAQKEQIKALHEANKPDQATMEEMKSLMQARRAGTLTDDQKARMQSFRDQQKAKMEVLHQQVLSILTPEQRAQVEARKAEMEKRRAERKALREQKKAAPAPNN